MMFRRQAPRPAMQNLGQGWETNCFMTKKSTTHIGGGESNICQCGILFATSDVIRWRKRERLTIDDQ